MPSKPVKPIPDGFHTVTPYLMVADAAALIDFLKAAFGAQELVRHGTPDGRVMHAQVKVGDSMIMMGEASAEQGGPMPASTYLYVPNVDEVYASAMAAGATSLMAPVDQFYGDRGTPGETCGGSEPTSRTCRPRRSNVAPRRP